MDYEKAYKESFEAAKGLHDAGNALTKKQMEIVFPQLAESEDERIRKALIEVFKEKLERGFEWVEYGIPNRSVLSWLEKQKEQKPVQSDVEREYVRTLKSLISDFLRWKEEVDREYYQQIFDWLDERHIEQKPILEVFGFKVGDAVRLKDGDGRKHIIKSFEEVEGLHGPNFYHVDFEDNSARSGIYPGEEYPNGYYTNMEKIDEPKDPFDDEQFRRGYEAGKNDAEKEINTQLIHWQERAHEEMMKERFPDYDIKVTTNDSVSELKASGDVYENVHNAMEQKPAEWSDEDKDMLNSCISSIEEAKENRYAYKETDGDTSYDHEIAWLKSIRNRVGKESLQPHWKPSEEEVRLINTSISFLKDFADKGYENAVECIDWLKSKLNGNSGK